MVGFTSSQTALLGFAALALLAIAPACSSSDDSAASAPDGVTCGSAASATDEASLRAGLDQGAGTCVVVKSAITSSTPIVVKSGVTLVGAKGARAAITVAGSPGPAIELEDNAKLGNIDLSVTNVSVGVAIRVPNARVFDVKVSGAKSAALAVNCSDAAACGAGTIALDNVSLEKSNYGLWALGGHLVIKGGRVGDNGGTSLSSGLGMFAGDSTKIEIEDTVIEKNNGIGLLLDGAKTTASVKNATISENDGRGVWAQRLNGTIDNPALKVEGCTITKNKIVGMGGVEARGIIIVGGKVVETQASPIPTDLEKNEMIGDGIAVLDGSTDWRVENTTVDLNARAAGILDHAEVGIIIVGGSVKAPAGGLKFVVQNSKASVQIADGDKSAVEKALGVSAPKITVPSVF